MVLVTVDFRLLEYHNAMDASVKIAILDLF
jgi:hypothetical protein